MSQAAQIAPPPPASTREWRRLALLALVLCLGVKVISLLVTPASIPDGLLIWDSTWYLGIMEHGYVHLPEQQSSLAFFPFLPMAARLLAAVGLSAPLALLLTAWIGSALSFVAIYALGAHLGGGRTGVYFALLWAMAPRAITQVLGYSEGWFVAFAALTLLAIVRRQWWRGALFCLLAGLTRPSVVPLLAVFALAVIAEMFRWRKERPTRAQVASALVSPLVAVSGFLGYVVFVGVQTGAWNGYFEVQKRWGTSLGSPIEGVQRAWEALLVPDRVPVAGSMAVTVTIFGYLLFWLVMLAWRERWELVVYSGLSIGMVLCIVGFFFHSKARLLLPAFPVFLPAARWLGAQRLRLSGPIMIALCAGSIWINTLVLGGRQSP